MPVESGRFSKFITSLMFVPNLLRSGSLENGDVGGRTGVPRLTLSGFGFKIGSSAVSLLA